MGHGFFERQQWHVVSLALLLAGAAWAARDPRVAAGAWAGLPTLVWFWIAIAVPIAHQLWVFVCWRLQLHGERMTHALGRAAFPLYGTVFALLFVGRFVAITLLAWSNRASIADAQAVLRWIALLAALPAAYASYSVVRYFGVHRAFGADHFDPEVRARGLVREGIFRFTPNGMYVFGLLALWIPGLALSSSSALVAALFSHTYIWVHYHCTEVPDLRRLYPAGGPSGYDRAVRSPDRR